MKTFKFLIVAFLTISLNGFSQTPSDFLSKEFHKERRDVLRSKMAKNSVSVVFSNPIRNRANDVDYVFHQDPNFYYLTGYREPNGVLVLFSEFQKDEKGNAYNEILYVQKKDAFAEMWYGKRLGTEKAAEELGFNITMNAEDFITTQIDFKKFDKVYIEQFKDDHRNSVRNKAEIYDLVATFKEKSGFNDIQFLSKKVENTYHQIANVPDKNMIALSKKIHQNLPNYPELQKDKLITNFANAKNDHELKDFKQKISFTLNAKNSQLLCKFSK